jgi:predicted HicB family RNase H-like nuclease
MKIRLDIPEKLHSKMTKKAQQEGISLNDFIVRSARSLLEDKANPLGIRRPPVIDSEQP